MEDDFDDNGMTREENIAFVEEKLAERFADLEHYESVGDTALAEMAGEGCMYWQHELAKITAVRPKLKRVKGRIIW
jgi:hypothetical protein|tara:strand:- start:1035 stop:1262 length:228 start_codon:yes stop_codon:yes gene_type:complete